MRSLPTWNPLASEPTMPFRLTARERQALTMLTLLVVLGLIGWWLL